MEMYIYGRMRSGIRGNVAEKMSPTQKRISTALDTLARKSYLKMMAHNFRGILKNLFDSGL